MRSAAARERAVVVTRDEAPDGPLCRELMRLGLPVLLWPVVQITGSDPGPLRRSLQQVASFDWIVFASRPAVSAVLAQLAQPPPHLRVAAVGAATAKVLRQRGWPVDVVPKEANAAGLVAAFAAWQQARPEAGATPGHPPRVLYPASSRALPTLAAGLTQLGATVTQVEAYRTGAAPLNLASCRAAIAQCAIAAVTFTSPSAVAELLQALGARDFEQLLREARAVCIGPTTARELTRHGHTGAVAEAATLEGLARTTHRLVNTGT